MPATKMKQVTYDMFWVQYSFIVASFADLHGPHSLIILLGLGY